jgi:hypothetical protein
MSDEARAARGHRAFNELTETNAAFDAVEAAIVRALSETPIGQEPKVLNLHKALQNLAAVKQAVRNVIDDGQVADYAIAQAGLDPRRLIRNYPGIARRIPPENHQMVNVRSSDPGRRPAVC